MNMDEITENEVQGAIKELKNNKSPGIDKISNELLKYAANILKCPVNIVHQMPE